MSSRHKFVSSQLLRCVQTCVLRHTPAVYAILGPKKPPRALCVPTAQPPRLTPALVNLVCRDSLQLEGVPAQVVSLEQSGT